MSRRDEWKKLQEEMTRDGGEIKSLETVPEQACGICLNFTDNAYGSDGRGSCNVLKAGSNISLPDVIITRSGENGYITFFNRDAKYCPNFERMKLIDTDGHECADPISRRVQRQLSSIKKS